MTSSTAWRSTRFGAGTPGNDCRRDCTITLVTEVCFVLAPRQNHFFVEVAEAMRFELEQLGVRAEVSRTGFPPLREGLAYVLVPPHEFRGLAPPSHWPTPRQLERTLFYCFEQPGTKFFDENVRLSQGPVGGVMDINTLGVEAFRREGVCAHHVPVGWTPEWAFVDPAAGGSPSEGAGHAGLAGPPERDVDLLHLGAYSPRRGQTLAQAADRLARWRTRLVLGDDHAPNSAAQANFAIDREKWSLLSRSRVLLNIHAGDRDYFEWLRVVQAIGNGAFVVSEHSMGTAPLRSGEHFASGAREELVALAEPYLEDEDLRASAARNALEFLKERLPLSASAEFVAQLADDIAYGPSELASGCETVSWPDNSGIRAEILEAATAAVPADSRDAFDWAEDGELVLIDDPRVELLPGGLRRLTAALEADPAAAFAWGMVADAAAGEDGRDAAGDDGAAPALRNVFPWQPWRLAHGDCIERPVLWRAAALRASDTATLDDGGDLDLYRRAAERDMRGSHVSEIVARRRSRSLDERTSSACE